MTDTAPMPGLRAEVSLLRRSQFRVWVSPSIRRLVVLPELFVVRPGQAVGAAAVVRDIQRGHEARPGWREESCALQSEEDGGPHLREVGEGLRVDQVLVGRARGECEAGPSAGMNDPSRSDPTFDRQVLELGEDGGQDVDGASGDAAAVLAGERAR
ncbi:hypothetical protein [Streptomyces xanthophaeus]